MADETASVRHSPARAPGWVRRSGKDLLPADPVHAVGSREAFELEGNRIAFYEHLLEFFEIQLAARKPSPDRDVTDEKASESALSTQAETL